MKLLLDTHVLLWALSSKHDLSTLVREALESDSNVIFVSLASLWELKIKEGLGKVHLPKNFYSSLEPAGYELLPIQLGHIEGIGKLPPHHRDPFDRLLIAQAKAEQLLLATRDENIKKYDVNILWA
ncbi:MAG: twitching motility protein PilT [Deltaproteobacteria bacterium RIFCSPLOWO2_12_FULL_40_28]|nr:MAG: twitching motility protein PilT [Deltaproteobacteria bacterium RIFCSPHIGHO2_02_FULL_40_28]OGQ20823.1 MAG: twitching motility protein PilT [Deltaproteobacteria bacterium RIFCSPHIGHO2_12_FULL_40_32]OGQ39224.1 MAG: twitching motility protein PilT [Deltaproteobacteria bacterium RIFCSPLOWO2_02_FULL_40_36]OGQ54505.1 MAG: twitching motility protein PilT [Deltaproteobacteria bacterium RIFCSPLOWO2_12_FULL_40_28]